MTKEVEDLILHSEYADLSAEERVLLSEWVGDEEAFGEMKWFLTETKATFARERISPTNELRSKVMSRLDKKEGGGIVWLSSIGTALFPSGKKLYQKPAVQLGIAAVVIIGAVFMVGKFNADTELAVNEPIVEQRNKVPEKLEPVVVEEEDNSLLNQNEMDGLDEVILAEYVELENERVEEHLEKAPVAPVLNLSKALDQMEPVEEVQVDDLAAEMDKDRLLVAPEDVSVDEVTASFDSQLELSDVEEEAFDADRELTEKFKASERKREETAAEGKRDAVLFIGDTIAGNALTGVTSNEQFNGTTPSTNYTFNSSATEAISISGGSEDYYKAIEEVNPKSLHIDQTKELNQLFFIEK